MTEVASVCSSEFYKILNTFSELFFSSFAKSLYILHKSLRLVRLHITAMDSNLLQLPESLL